MNDLKQIEGIFRSRHHPEYIMEIREVDDEMYADLFEFTLLEPERRQLFKRKLELSGLNSLKGIALSIEFPDKEFNSFSISEEPIAMIQLKGTWERIDYSLE